MALPRLENHDFRIRYYELMLRGDITGMREIPLPAGYHYELYQPGDRDAWIGIEKSAKEFETYEQGLDAWKRYYEGRDDELVNRMVFVVNEKGEKVATATAFYDIRGIDQSADGWLHWVAVRREDQGKGLSKPLISHVIQIIRNDSFTPVAALITFVDYIHDRFREGMGCFEDNIAILVSNSVKGNNIARYVLFHDVLYFQVLTVEVFQFLITADLPCAIGTDTVIWLDNHRIADFFDEVFTCLKG